ncbi:hypothetical protein ACFLS4_00160 [Bacteroidota bacterium]
MSNTRREFLKTALMSSAVFFVPLSQFKLFAGTNSISSLTDDELMDLANQARELFFMRKFDESEKIYLQIIESRPGEILFYEGLKKVYGAQNKDLLIAELFRKGWLLNQNDSIFCAKFANELAKLALSNKKHSTEFVEKYGVDNILDESISLFNQSISYNPENSFARRNLNHTVEAKQNLHEIEREEKKRYKRKKNFTNKSYGNFSETKILNRLEQIKNKERRTLYFEDEVICRDENLKKSEKKIYQALYKKHRRKKDFSSAENFMLKIYELDKNDTNIIGEIRKFYKKQKDYNKLVSFSRDVLKDKNDFWSYVALAKSLRLAYENTNSKAQLEESISIYNHLKDNWAGEFDNIDLTIYDGLANCYRLNNEYYNAIELYDYIDHNLSSSKRHIKNTVCIGKAKVLLQQDNYDEAISLIERQLSKNINSEYTPSYRKASLKAKKNVQINEDMEDIVLYSFLAKANHKKGNGTEVKRLYKKIYKIQPKDKNAEKLSKI